ncbi:cobyrinate a,c-diamide synthase [Aquihabitans sp. G128]|uniref:cobyrinate a,c-diamide synthase n=1 Tax=Aquihabitans sp. G128 TaxID=2849779 RepID=UPI001C230DBA|nr:cobyrinate a,c-diamide synthase [Aquihabitans sp. G128]QXC59192.1 cobyrinate a,c-diamide synthase [Aquihabitans sp. G128]
MAGTVALPPRLVVAGTHSGAGKTSVATGLAAALVAAGHRVATAKVGPDFIDPGYHAVATGRPGRNLDAWMSGAAAVPALAERAAGDADVLVVEGVMGLFDGAASAVPGAVDPARDDASTAHVARLLDTPVVLVVDAASMSRSVAAIVHGFVAFDPDVRVAGVILNRVGSAGHEQLLRDAIEPLGVPVLGVLRRDDAFSWRDRHLGLVPVVEQRDEVAASVDRLAAAVAAGCDLEAVVRLARTAPAAVVGAPLPAAERVVPAGAAPLHIAVAGGPAFSFSYPDNVERLAETGAEVVSFDPLVDPALPEGVAGLVVGGGFPEVFGAALAENRPLLADVASRVGGGLPTWAECGGLLWLARSLDGHAMAGVIAADGVMTDRLSLGYRTAEVLVDTPVAPVGSWLRGHEFHYSQLTPPGAALHLEGRFGRGDAGHASPTLLASYLHLHLGADPSPAERFTSACLAAR